MPTASDGKKFPYTPEGIKAHSRYEAKLKRNNKTMGTDKNKSVASAGGLYAKDKYTQILEKKMTPYMQSMYQAINK